MKNKTIDQQVIEGIKKVSDEDLKYLNVKLSQRLGGDVGEIMEFIYDQHPDLNKVVAGAGSCEETYNMIDTIESHTKEIMANRRTGRN